ncbi:unnamed protein product [Calypogeia fissa]
MEWELSKENVQPLKAGRNVEVLNNALKVKVEGHTRSNSFDHRRRQFLEDIENYVGEDPLDPWIRYIKWFRDAYPGGGAQSEVLKLLEKCSRQFLKDERYRRDVRYLQIWVQYADCCSDPIDVFAFLEANDIGQDHALFYEAYATSLEIRRNFSRADEIYNLGLHRSAQRLSRLESMYRSFLNRMHQRADRKSREEQQAVAGNYNENNVQSRSFGRPAVYSGDAGGQHHERHRARQGAMPPPRQPTSRSGNAAMSVFVDAQFGGPPTVAAQEALVTKSQLPSWSHLASAADKLKENAQQPSRWTDAKVGQEAHGQHGPRSDLNILVDEEFVEAHSYKPPINVTKRSAPSLRLRLEDMQKIRRYSPDLKGSFLDFPEGFHASTAQGSNQYLSESSRNGYVKDAAAQKSCPETVFGYDTSLLEANGTERNFEEFRLQLWYDRQQTLHAENQENTPTTIADTEKYSDPHASAHPSCSPDTDMVKESRCSTDFEAGNATKDFNGSPQPSSSQGDVDGDDLNQREGLLLPYYNQKRVTDDVINSDGEAIVDCLSRELAAGKEDPLTDCELQPQKEALPPFRADHEAIVHLNSFSIQGDETVAIKRFAEEVIVLGSDPKVNSIDTVSHHGLVEPTINTKEALADILDMFNKPLECDNERSKVRKPKDTKNRSSNSLAKSSGFEIFVDDGLEIQSPPQTKKNEKRTKAVSGKCLADPIVKTRDFHSFADENSDVQPFSGSGKNYRDLSKPLDSVARFSGFDVYVDEDLEVQGPSNSKKRIGNHGVTSNNSSLDPVHQSCGLDIFVDDEFQLHGTRDSSNFQGESSAATGAALHPAFGSSTFQILADDDLIMKETLQPAKNDECGSFQILGDDNLASKEPLKPVINDDSSTLPIFVDDDLVIRQPTKADHTFTASTVRPSSCQSIGVDDELRELSLSSNKVDQCELAGNSHEAQRKQEVNAEPMRMTVNPWDERNLQDLLVRLNSQIKQYEGFFESDEKYSGSIPVSSLRSSTCRNKILLLGCSTYRLKASVGQGAFAQVFEVEDEDDDLFENPTKLALKFQKPACPWEFYIYRQLDVRVCDEDRYYFGQVRRFHLFSDSSFLICNYRDKGTLQDVINAYLAMGQRMDETLCMFYTIEMLRILETLHAVGIIHGDFKPDNLLIRDDSDELVEDWTPDRRGCWKAQGLFLIDWGRSVDLTLYPEGTQFMGDCKTDSFRCPMMIEHRPWSFQVDTFGLCGVVHCLLHGNYMQIEKAQTAAGQTIYRPKSSYRRYWNVELWREFFETLLNVKDSPQKAPLSALRQSFESHLRDKSLGKKVKGLLAKQTIMMFSRRHTKTSGIAYGNARNQKRYGGE